MDGGSETQDEKLDELVELAYSTGETSFLPGTLVDGNKYSVTINKTLAKALKIGRVGVGQYESVTLHLTDEEKRWANSAYADALWNGSGRDVDGAAEADGQPQVAENERRSEDDRCEGGSGEGEEGGAGGNGEEEVMERPGRLPCGARPGMELRGND